LLFLILCIHQVAIYLISARSLKPFIFFLLPFAFCLSAVSYQLLSVMRRHFLCPMRYALCAMLFALCLWPSAALAANVTLAWDSNQENDIAGYILYYGMSSGNYTSNIDVGNINQYTLPALQDGVTYYFAVTAYNLDDYESDYSQELHYTVGSQTYTISASAGANGSITPAGAVAVNRGASQSFTISAAQNYQVLAVMVDGSSVGAVASYTFTNVTQNHTISASFVSSNHAPTADAGANQTVTEGAAVTLNGSNSTVVDSDGDGVPDDQDAFPYDPDEYLDTDGDGEGNNADLDDDNDGLPDQWELAYGLNPLKNDAAGDPDGDGVTNINEYNLGTAPNHSEGNFNPNPPILLTPENGATVGLTPRFETDQFDDPNVNDVHSKTQWKIVRAFDNVCVFEVTSSNSLTSIEIPNLILEEDTDYVWQVKFRDNHDSASNWSDAGYFTTDFNNQDLNGNGIRDNQELDATLDLDEDGIPDSEQDDIKSVGVEGESTQIGISIRGADTIQSIEAFESENLADLQPHANSLDQPAILPYGLIGFKLIVDIPGDEVLVTLHLSEAAPADSTWFKYDPVEDVWYDYSSYTEFSADRKRVYLTLVDGGFGDVDGIANGIIVDPLGLGVTSSPAPTETVSGGGGSGAGCFISASSNSIKLSGPAAIRQKLTELAFVLTLLLVAFISVFIIGSP
jgi:hypothetical protein